MGEVLTTMKIMPDSPEVDLDAIKATIIATYTRKPYDKNTSPNHPSLSAKGSVLFSDKEGKAWSIQLLM